MEGQVTAVEEDAAGDRDHRRTGEKLRLDTEVPDRHLRRAELPQVVGVRRGVGENQVCRPQCGAVERGERATDRPARTEELAVVHQRLGEAHERREDEPGPRPAEAAGEEHVELATEAHDDERLGLLGQSAPALRELPRRADVARRQPGERQRAEVAPALVRRLLPEGLVALGHREPGAGEGEAKEAIGAVRADVRAEEARRHRGRRPSARCGSRAGSSSANRMTSGPSPPRSSISRTRQSASSSRERLLPIRSATNPISMV